MDYNIIIIHEPKIGSIKHQSSKTCPDRKWSRMNWYFILSQLKLKAHVVIYSQEFILHRSSIPQQQKSCSWTVVSRPSNHENMFDWTQPIDLCYRATTPKAPCHVSSRVQRCKRKDNVTLSYENAHFRVGIWLKPIEWWKLCNSAFIYAHNRHRHGFPRLTPVSCLSKGVIKLSWASIDRQIDICWRIPNRQEWYLLVWGPEIDVV